MKITTYTVRASGTQMAKWAHWARKAGYKAVGKWLERLADREIRRLEYESGYRRPNPPR
jgi:hypothetical protein